MQLDLTGRNVLVTGGSRGIGRSIALTFAQAGANVSICARGESALHETAAELRRMDHRVHAMTCDLADASAVSGYVTSAAEALGGIEIDGMSVRFFLAGFIDAGAGMLDESAGFFGEFAFCINRIGNDVPAGVIGNEHVLAGFIDDDVAGVCAFGTYSVDFGEFGRIGRIDLEGGDGAGFLAVEIVEFVDGVEELFVGVDGEEGRAFSFGGEADLFEGAGTRVEFVGVDTFAGSAGVSADENGEILRCSC